MNITVQIKSNYGKDVAYPVCEKAKLFCELAGTKTITEDMSFIIEQLGYEFIIQQSNYWRG